MPNDDKFKNEKPNQPGPASAPQTPAEAEELPIEMQLMEFWDKNKNIILGVVCVAVIALSAYAIGNWWLERKHERLGLALTNAKTPADFTRVAEEFRGENVGAYALLLLADEQYRDAKYKDSAKTYQRVVDEYPQNALAGSALYGKASALESDGDYKMAQSTYESVSQRYANDLHAADARLGIGRCLEAQNNPQKARQTYEEIIAQFPNTQWAYQAQGRITVLDREARAKGQVLTATPAAPANPLVPQMPVAPVTPPTKAPGK